MFAARLHVLWASCGAVLVTLVYRAVLAQDAAPALAPNRATQAQRGPDPLSPIRPPRLTFPPDMREGRLFKVTATFSDALSGSPTLELSNPKLQPRKPERASRGVWQFPLYMPEGEYRARALLRDPRSGQTSTTLWTSFRVGAPIELRLLTKTPEAGSPLVFEVLSVSGIAPIFAITPPVREFGVDSKSETGSWRFVGTLPAGNYRARAAIASNPSVEVDAMVGRAAEVAFHVAPPPSATAPPPPATARPPPAPPTSDGRTQLEVAAKPPAFGLWLLSSLLAVGVVGYARWWRGRSDRWAREVLEPGAAAAPLLRPYTRARWRYAGPLFEREHGSPHIATRIRVHLRPPVILARVVPEGVTPLSHLGSGDLPERLIVKRSASP